METDAIVHAGKRKTTEVSSEIPNQYIRVADETEDTFQQPALPVIPADVAAIASASVVAIPATTSPSSSNNRTTATLSPPAPDGATDFVAPAPLPPQTANALPDAQPADEADSDSGSAVASQCSHTSHTSMTLRRHRRKVGMPPKRDS